MGEAVALLSTPPPTHTRMLGSRGSIIVQGSRLRGLWSKLRHTQENMRNMYGLKPLGQPALPQSAPQTGALPGSGMKHKPGPASRLVPF